ncbi:MAG: thiamine ABC transporter substrate-binding protein [Limnochordia bacterium]|jgi:thiamine transport system substrate-binding protein
MKRCRLLLVSVVLATLLWSGIGEGKPRLVVYTYDSFVSWGPANEIETGFERMHDVDVVFVAPASSGEMLARLISEMETGGSEADVFVGLSDTYLSRVHSRNVFRPIDPAKVPNLRVIPENLQFDAKGHLVPFDHGYITLVYDTRSIKAEDLPQTFEDLTDPRFRNKIIAIDPRTSSVGHAFLMWTIQHYGEDGFVDFWRRLSPNLLTIAGGWSAAYKMFTNGDAPIVISYATDTAYAVMEGQGPVYGVLPLHGAGYLQIEGMGIVRTSRNVDLAHAFVDYLLSPEIQRLIPTTNWMYPANPQAELPEEWVQYAQPPEKSARMDPEELDRKEATWLRQWAMAISM